jgi:hypothetical protein
MYMVIVCFRWWWCCWWNEGRVEMVPSKQSTVAQTQHQTSVGYLLHLLKRLYHV